MEAFFGEMSRRKGEGIGRPQGIATIALTQFGAV
jgi:hypothetical protein